MSKQLSALLAALIVPYLIYSLVISLNEHDSRITKAVEKQVSFDVKKQKQIQKPKIKKKPKQVRKRVNQALPSIKPTDIGSSVAGSGLSFGVPVFNESEFSDIADGGLLDSFGNNAMDRDSVDTPPKVIKRSPIVYPELARKQGISGYVAMNVLIDEYGNVEDVDIVDSEPEEVFDLKADSTIRNWKFEPGTYNGKKVKVWALQKIVFKLD